MSGPYRIEEFNHTIRIRNLCTRKLIGGDFSTYGEANRYLIQKNKASNMDRIGLIFKAPKNIPWGDSDA